MTKIAISNKAQTNCLISAIIKSEGKSNFKSIAKNYFITSHQHHNWVIKERDGHFWKELRKQVTKEIDNDLKMMMMILRSQEVNLKLINDKSEVMVMS